MKRCLLTIMIMFTAVFLNAAKLEDLYSQRMLAESRGDNVWFIDHSLAQTYLGQRNYELAGKFWISSYENAPDDSTKIAMKLNILRLHMIQGNMSTAESGLLSLYIRKDLCEGNRYRVRYLLCMLNALNGRYDAGRGFFVEMTDMNSDWPDNAVTVLDSIFRDADRRKSVKTARRLSTFIPGAGQIYARNFKGTLGAVGLACLWGGMFTYDIINQDYYSALVVLLWPWQRYHRGNIHNAEESAIQYNLRLEDVINRAFLDYLSTQQSREDR